MKKKIVLLLLLLSTFFLFGTMSAMADPEPSKLTVKVNGETFTGNDGTWFGTNGQNGYVNLSSEENIVFLEELTLTTVNEVDEDIMAALYIESEDPVTVWLQGDCQFLLENDEEHGFVGIYADCPKLTIYGLGNLTISFSDPQYVTSGIVTYGALTIDNTTVIANDAMNVVCCTTLGLRYGTLEGALYYEAVSELVMDETVILKGGKNAESLQDYETVEELLKCPYVKIKNPQYYNVSVNGVELSEKNPVVECGDGKAYVDLDLIVSFPHLYLENATITKGIVDPESMIYAGIVFEEPYCIQLIGDNVIDLKQDGCTVCGIYGKDYVEIFADDYTETEEYCGTKLDIRCEASEGYDSIGCYVPEKLYLCAADITMQADYALVGFGRFYCDTCRLELIGKYNAFDSTNVTSFNLWNSGLGKNYGDTEKSDGSTKQELTEEDLQKADFMEYKYLLFDEERRSEVFVNGEEFTSGKTVIPCGDGTATYNFEKNELTLENATITLDGTANLHFDSTIANKFHLPDDIECGIFGLFESLVLKGTNTIIMEPGESPADILHVCILQPDTVNEDDWTLTVKGTGTLNISIVGEKYSTSAFGIMIGSGTTSEQQLILQDLVSVNVSNSILAALYAHELDVVMKESASLSLSGLPVFYGEILIDTDGMTADFTAEADYETQDGSNAEPWEGSIYGDEKYLSILADKRIDDTVDVIHANMARDGLTVTWEKADEESGYTYRLLRDIVPDEGKTVANWTVVAENLTTTGYYDKTVEPGVQYVYAVQLCLGEICGETGKTATGRYMTSPIIETVENRSGSVRVT